MTIDVHSEPTSAKRSQTGVIALGILVAVAVVAGFGALVFLAA